VGIDADEVVRGDERVVVVLCLAEWQRGDVAECVWFDRVLRG
jgi:hypothetical protein